ncbi:DUF2635 domain-containing protein [Roseomonas indoligenes]|uniref:DUF2635 domain-containing protein n=1 Tax=Roseomonas indoligenes TaxID=2820811 RepID=A0A940MX83_9PROT|nr:DUF2635 domain-containing protein [Pararoseomonas indoligenes]MBP0492151.1 DUF2635 domain-containing protein [Pararoseomonas indoligenes]
MFVVPKAGLKVPDPVQGGFLPPEGRLVEGNQYWIRRALDGDVTVLSDDTPPPVPFAFIQIPPGTTAQRPAPGIFGRLYGNTDLGLPEFDTGTTWVTLGAGGGGGNGGGTTPSGNLRLLEGGGYRLLEGGGRRLLEAT